MTAPTLDVPAGGTGGDAVDAFVTAVRSHLADLPPATVDDLVEGLASDLADLVSEGGGAPLSALVLSPDRYAAELRDAAGLPPAGSNRGRWRLPDPIAGTRRGVRRIWASVPRRWRDEVVAFLSAVVPAWWVLRGIAAAAALNILVKLGGGMYALLIAAGIVASVQLGRGRDRRPRVDRWTNRVAALLLVVTLPVLAGFLSRGFGHEADGQSYLLEGVTVDGFPASNLFVYGPDGRLVRDARVLDDRGYPLSVLGGPGPEVPPGPVYPLSSTEWDSLGNERQVLATPPVERLPALAPAAVAGDGEGAGTGVRPEPPL